MPRKHPPEVTAGEAQQFATLYLKHHCNGSQAMRELRPGLKPGAARQQAHRFLKRADITEAITRLQRTMTKETILTLTQAQERLTKIATSHPDIFPPPTPSEQIAAIRQLGLFQAWEPKEDPGGKPVSETGTLLARIRMARNPAPLQIQEAVFTIEDAKPPAQ